MLEINKRYIRRSPVGDESVIHIKIEEEQHHYQSLLESNFTYSEIVPVVARGKVCESCEG